MKTSTLAVSMTLALLPTFASAAANPDELAAIRQQIQSLQSDYERRIQALETRLAQAEAETQAAKQAASEAQSAASTSATSSAAAAPPPRSAANAFNPAISLILDGKLTQFSNDPEEYALPGFQLGGEAGPGDEGFSVQHSELMISANADDMFFGQLTAAIASHEGAPRSNSKRRTSRQRRWATDSICVAAVSIPVSAISISSTPMPGISPTRRSSIGPCSAINSMTTVCN